MAVLGSKATCRDEPTDDEQGTSFFDNPYLFQARRWCTETNLYYFRHRDLSPTLGRFMQRDPIGYADGMNLYESFAGNPSAGVDPLGRSIWDWIPIVSSIKRACTNPKGSKIEDYEHLKITREEVERWGLEIAKLRCKRRIGVQVAKYMAEYAPGLGKAITGDIGTATLATIVKRAGMKELAKRAGGAWVPIAGWVLTADAVANLAGTIEDLLDIRDAGKEAIKKYCVCPPK